MMSTPSKTGNEATHTSNTNMPGAKTATVTSIIRRIVESELVPTNEKYVLRDEHKQAKCYRANFSFKGNLRYYLNLQNQISREGKRLSDLITFTSSCGGPDALAVPASTYVTDTWGCDGATILQMVDASMGSATIRRVSSTLTSGCEIRITVNRDDLHLMVMGGLKKCPRSSIIGVIEQICWLVSVAGNTPTSSLAKHVEEVKQGKPTREYSDTIYTGNPVMETGDGTCISVSFAEPARPFRQAHQVLVRTSGHCWKTMAGVTIVANGFAIPPRPRQGSGLEASLSVLRELIRRGCHGRSPFTLERPMVVFPPREVSRADKSGQASTVYKLRYILAAEYEQPLRKRGNIVYWHFDAGKECTSEESLDQVEGGIGVEPEAIDPESRHFVGWTKSAGHLAAAHKEIPLPTYSACTVCPHYQLVVSTLSVTVRVPPVFTASATFAAEKNDTEIPKMPPLVDRQQILHHVTARLFVLWDKVLQRGWLVGGDTVTLLLLRVYAKKTKDAKLKNIDFSLLDNAGDSASSAYKVLAELNDMADRADKADKDKAEKEEAGRDEKKKKTEKTSVGAYLDELYAILMALSDKNADLNKTHAMSTALQTWYHRKRATTFTGVDFDELTGNATPPQFYNYRIKKDPGWVRWVKEESLTFMLASGLGEVLEPKDGSCCSFFPTLPAGQNYLAAELRILKRFITKYAGGEDCFPPDQTVARLSRNQGWERRSDPFPRQKCHDGVEPSAIGPSCFPVQGTLSAPLMDDTSEILRKDRGLLRDKPLYTVKDIKIMIDNNPGGVVVFGRQPRHKELGEISWRSRQRSQFARRPTVTATAAQSSDRPSSRGSVSGSTTAQSLESPGKERARTANLLSASGQRAPSMTSMRSNSSRTHPGSSQGNTAGVGQPRPTTSRSPSTSVQRATSNTSLRSTISHTRPKASLGDSSGAAPAQSTATQSPASSAHTAASNASLRSIGSKAHPKASRDSSNEDDQPQAVISRTSEASVHKTASSTSMRSTASRTHPTTLQGSNIGSTNGASHPPVLSSRSPAPSIRQAASNASLKSTSSATRSIASHGGAGRSHESSAVSNAQIPARMASNSSIRTTSSAASRATNGSQPQRPSAQASDMGLKKIATNSSDRTTGSQSSRIAQNLEAFNSNRQQQQQQMAPAPPTSSNQGSSSGGATKSSHPSSSGPAPTAAGGPESSS